jgi:hypothetical protein
MKLTCGIPPCEGMQLMLLSSPALPAGPQLGRS